MSQRLYRSGVFLLLSALAVFLLGCDKSAEDMYKKAMEFYQTGRYQKAVQLFEAILTTYPEHNLTQSSRYQLGKIYLYKLNQPQKGLKHLQELYAQAPQGRYAMNALERIGYIYDVSLNRCLDGLEAYRRLIQEYASGIEVSKYQLAIGECYFSLGDYAQAITEYEVLRDHYSGGEYFKRANFQIANSYALTENYPKAIELYKELLLSETLSDQFVVNVKLELAYCYKQTGEFQKALDLYEELLEVDTRQVALDSDLIARKRERILERIIQNNRKPREVNWKR